MLKLSRDQAPWIKTLHSRWFSHGLKWMSIWKCLVSLCLHNAWFPAHTMALFQQQEKPSTWPSLQSVHSYIIGNVAFVHLKLRRSLVQSHLYPRRGFSCVDQGFFSAGEIISMHVAQNGTGDLGNFSYWLNPTLQSFLAQVLQTTWVCPCSSGPSVVQGEEHLLGQEQREEHLPGIPTRKLVKLFLDLTHTWIKC